ncbi:MAG: hypothetical protein GQF41_3661 [Candidatus Rifleibacterium amylolyticum]|nr:MAG: hypothetical protein GQF41_3661 [Candidatus Rifleibacterium amylolyticum]
MFHMSYLPQKNFVSSISSFIARSQLFLAHNMENAWVL